MDSDGGGFFKSAPVSRDDLYPCGMLHKACAGASPTRKARTEWKKKWHVASLPVMSLSPVASADQTLRPVTARESEGRERFRGFGRRGGRGARKDPLGI